jgi:hypothetical protein
MVISAQVLKDAFPLTRLPAPAPHPSQEQQGGTDADQSSSKQDGRICRSARAGLLKHAEQWSELTHGACQNSQDEYDQAQLLDKCQLAE